MESVNSANLSRLNKYIKTFSLKYSEIARELDLDNSTIPKYFNGRAKCSINRYNEIVEALRKFADNDELKLYLIDTWLKVESTDEKKNTLKRLSKELTTVSLEISEIIGE